MTKNKSLQLEEGKTYSFYVHNVKDGKGGQTGSIDVKTSKGSSESFTVAVKKAELGKRTLASLKHQMVALVCHKVEGKLKLFLSDGKSVVAPSASTAQVPPACDKPSAPSNNIPSSSENAKVPKISQSGAEPSAVSVVASETTSNSYEAGREYEVKVWYWNEPRKKLTVEIPGAKYIDIPVTSELCKTILDGANVQVICVEVGADGAPLFELAKSYYATRINRMEGGKVEFKSSIIFSPDTHRPSASQPLQIAKEIAAFMNSDGGTLYLGVADKGTVVGIEGDLNHLGEAVLRKGDYTDKHHTYHANLDGFALKLKALIRFYLGDFASTLVDDPEFVKDDASGCTYAKVKIRPSEKGVIYWGPQELVCFRDGSASVELRGRGQDEYVRRRFYERTEQDFSALLKQFTASQEAENVKLRQELQALTDGLAKGQTLPAVQVVGEKVSFTADSFVALTDAHFAAVTAIKGIIYKANTPMQKIGHAETWKEFYEKLLEILAELDPEKFSQLPDLQEFKPTRSTAEPYFLRKGARKKLTAPSKKYLGREGDIRANLRCAVNKAAFQNGRSIPLRLLAYFGVKPEDIAVLVK